LVDCDVTGSKQNSSCRRRHGALALAFACAGLVAGFLATGLVMAQDRGAATVKDVIFARKTLMNSICEKMSRIERMISMGQVDLDGANVDAEAISVMLMAFPHLFPPSSNQWNPDADPDPATDTYASPELWTGFADFYQMAAAASSTAHAMGRADKIDDFKDRARELRIECDTCHALYSENQ
jgi:cytochrome c556